MSYRCSRCELDDIPIPSRSQLDSRTDTATLLCYACTSNTTHVPVPGANDV